jgi:SAM-dependent methyltransferase
MHIPDVERAVAELARVLAPGGLLVVSEANADGLDARLASIVQRMRRTKPLPRGAAGVELWKETPAGSFLTRRADIPWLVRDFRRHGLVLRRRQAGQLSELYARAPFGLARRAVHALNRAWVALDGPASIASANILTFERPAA